VNDHAMDLLERVLDAPPCISLQAIEALKTGTLTEAAAGGPITVRRGSPEHGIGWWIVSWPGIPDAPDRPGIPGNRFTARSPRRALFYVERFAKQAARP
jgi:hypothetical protein